MELTTAWTEITRRQYVGAGRRYASDLTDAESALLELLMPAHRQLANPGKQICG
jgi:putative transposase